MLKPYYTQQSTQGVLPPRSYYVPFKESDKKSYDREDSSRFISLNGKWQITPYESVLDADQFWQKKAQNPIDVPSCVQFYGYDYFQYTNARYPFPFNPPHVPEKNPAYHYSRNFMWNGEGEKAYLVFEGVDSCFYVYINGKEVGYSNISHRISEFDITPYIVNGNNKLDVLVVKWNACSYLEDQDKWRLTGIFRDVYLICRPFSHITDYKIETEIDGGNGVVTFINKSQIDIKVTFNGEEKLVLKNEKGKFIVQNAKLWSAETPFLYPMELSANGEKIYNRVGIKTSQIKDGLYLFNGKPIKFYGINRHDFHPEKGYAVNKDDMLLDIKLMKSLNINAIRTSHYPSSPLLYQMCDEYGLYMISEADMESHGAAFKENGYDEKLHARIVNNSLFEKSVIERTVTNVEEHKNFSCVVMWSLGNESGWGESLKKALVACEELDQTRPVHYENINTYMADEEEYYKGSNLKMVSKMYFTPEWMLNEFLNDERETRPLILCEYAHAMGNGPGGLMKYINAMDKSDRFMGGFIWEWADHAIKYKDENFKYGGDFGEGLHDSNFCVDGIVSADRKFKAGTLQMKYAYQPLKFEKVKNTLIITNKNYFKVEIGELDINGERQNICIAPRESIQIKVKSGEIKAKYFVDNNLTSWAQFMPKTKKEKFVFTTFKYKENDKFITVKAGKNKYKLNKKTGLIDGVNADGFNYGAINLNLYRAPTDNDAHINERWLDAKLNAPITKVKDYQINDTSVSFNVEVYGETQKNMTAKISYTFNNKGVNIETNYRKARNTKFEYLPRVGLKLTLDKSFDRLKYKAYGESETYPDMYEYAFKDEFESTVKAQYHHYVKPQDSGSHYLPDYAKLTDGTNTIYVSGMQSFSALPYSAEQLVNAKHDFELPISDATYLCVDYQVSGLGTNSCGPLPQKCYWAKSSFKGDITFIFDQNND